MAPRSLFDGVDLVRLPRDPLGVVLAVCAHDPAELAWPDRDRVVIGATRLHRRAAAVGGLDEPPGSALAVALGLAAASRAHGGIFRVWCVLDAAALDAGPIWEAAVAATAAATDQLTVVAIDGGHDLWSAAGWATGRAGPDPVAFIGALDHVLAASGPGAVLVS